MVRSMRWAGRTAPPSAGSVDRGPDRCGSGPFRVGGQRPIETHEMKILRVAWLVRLLLLLLVTSGLAGRSVAEELNQAGLVVQFADGRVETRCVSFEGDQITGADLLVVSGMEVVVDPSSGMGITVCLIEDEGCSYPAEPCFCQCMGGGECSYWNYFYRDPAPAGWSYSALGAAMRKIVPGSVEGWVWGNGQSSPDEDLTFEMICAAPTPNPTETGEPPASSPTETSEPPSPAPTGTSLSPSDTPRPTDRPTDRPTEQPSTPLPPSSPAPQASADTEPQSSSYWPFVLMLVGLALVGGLVWFWRR